VKLTTFLLAASLPLFLAACSDSDSNSYSNVDFSVSDAPVEGLSAVTIAFDRLEFIHSDGERIFYDIDGYEQVNLLDYPDTQSALIISDIPLRVGEYKNLIIHIKPDQDLNYVIKTNALGVQEDLKQPSNKLKLGSFTVADEAVQAFTIEFDLRQALVLRGNQNNNNGYNLKPHGVTIVDNGNAASIRGSVAASLLDAGDCDAATGNIVYLYQGIGLDVDALIDNVDLLDVDFEDNNSPEAGSIAPYASTGINGANEFAFGFLPAGGYTLAFSCSAVGDDPIQFDDFMIPNPVGQVVDITLSMGEVGTYKFE